VQVKTQKPRNDTKLTPIIVPSSSDDEQKLETPDVGLESDSDSDYDNLHGGYDMHWSTVRYLFFLGVCLVILYVVQSSPDLDTEDHGDPIDSIGAAVAKLSLNHVKSYLPSESRSSASLKESGHAWASSLVYEGVSTHSIYLFDNSHCFSAAFIPPAGKIEADWATASIVWWRSITNRAS
jgi:hypothetical protein